MASFDDVVECINRSTNHGFYRGTMSNDVVSKNRKISLVDMKHSIVVVKNGKSVAKVSLSGVYTEVADMIISNYL
jgi:hypothetical protein